MNSLARGKRASGDLIPWTVSQQASHCLRLGVACGCTGITVLRL